MRKQCIVILAVVLLLVSTAIMIKFGTLPQADPNGLFMPTSSSATWLMMIDPETNKPRPVYIEPEIIVSPFRLVETMSAAHF